jgi:1,4-alpha-glucan branching enzyme
MQAPDEINLYIREKGYFYLNEGELDTHLFHEGTFYKSHEFLGAHPLQRFHIDAVRFVVWAPHAKAIHLIGDFNHWHEYNLPLQRIGKSGLWQICVPNVQCFDAYKYKIEGQNGDILYKADPYAFHSEERPKTASKYYDITGYHWHDDLWTAAKGTHDLYRSPMSIYEVNLLSWRKKADGAQYSYHDLAEALIPYVKDLGYTHIELMPIMEHPFDGSWGYQGTGYFAPTSRFGTPKDFMYFIDQCHQAGIGIILDWVPGHYCKDEHGLYYFDGSPTFESDDYELAHNDQWGTANFDYGKPEVMSFLISNALYWHDYYHIDGMRVDAVAYMLYLNFGGKLLKNKYGGIEHLEAISFLKKLNQVIFQHHPNTLMIAEESTSWPMVTKPVSAGGLGFNYKWNMGWMNDILEYMALDPLYRKGFHKALTFSITYAFSENFILPLSHDEVVHGKHSLLSKMPGTYDEKFANLRLLYAYMFAHPGKKLVFMGGEFGQFIEWNEWQALDWHLMDYPAHRNMHAYAKVLNHLYQNEPCLFELDVDHKGYEWIEVDNANESIISFERIDKSGERMVLIFNFTPVHRDNYPVGVTKPGTYEVVLNTQSHVFTGNLKDHYPSHYRSKKELMHHRFHALRITLPAFGGLYLKYKEG